MREITAINFQGIQLVSHPASEQSPKESYWGKALKVLILEYAPSQKPSLIKSDNPEYCNYIHAKTLKPHEVNELVLGNKFTKAKAVHRVLQRYSSLDTIITTIPQDEALEILKELNRLNKRKNRNQPEPVRHYNLQFIGY